jgi:hypothetical protein
MTKTKWNPVKLFLDHPHSVNETYFEHLRNASTYGFRLLLAGFACLIHSLLPFLCVTTASDTMQKIQTEIAERKNTLSSN